MTALSEEAKQLRPGLWETINERYPGSMITKADFVPLARLNETDSDEASLDINQFSATRFAWLEERVA